MWKRSFPFINRLVRKVNLQIQTFEEVIESKTDSSRRALINELGFRIFEAGYNLGQTELDNYYLDNLSKEVCKYIARLERVQEIEQPSSNEQKESLLIAQRTKDYFKYYEPNQKLILSPAFSGCGAISSCFGDVLTNDSLYEIKSGEREFRSSDIKQLLVYTTLNFSKHNNSIKNIALLNPRLGKAVSLDLKDSIEIASGKCATDAFYELINFFDNPEDFR